MHVQIVACHGGTDGKSTNPPTPSPEHINPNNPFYFFAFGKKVVDGKNSDRAKRQESYRRSKQLIGRPGGWTAGEKVIADYS